MFGQFRRLAISVFDLGSWSAGAESRLNDHRNRLDALEREAGQAKSDAFQLRNVLSNKEAARRPFGHTTAEVTPYDTFADIARKMKASEQADTPPRLTVHEIAERWGVKSLDVVNAVMRKFVGPAPFGSSTWSLISVEAVERKMLMPGAVMRFVDEGGLEAAGD